MVIRAQHAARFVTTGIETAIELLACVLFDRTKRDELMCGWHKRKADHKVRLQGPSSTSLEPTNPESRVPARRR
jgi:hypothetical protein